MTLPCTINHCIADGCAFIADSFTPLTYESATDSKNSTKWKQAIDDEVKSLHQNGTWKLVSLPEGQLIVDCKWIYQVRPAARNEGERYKAR